MPSLVPTPASLLHGLIQRAVIEGLVLDDDARAGTLTTLSGLAA
jgi:hypothetical protein